MIEELDTILEKLKTALETTGLKGGVSFHKVVVGESTKEGTGYLAYYGVAVELPHSNKHYGAGFGKDGELTP
jgi:hypothetical protein